MPCPLITALSDCKACNVAVPAAVLLLTGASCAWKDQESAAVAGPAVSAKVPRVRVGRARRADLFLTMAFWRMGGGRIVRQITGCCLFRRRPESMQTTNFF